MQIMCSAAEPPRLPLRRELSSLSVFNGATEGEITRGRCLLRGVDEHQMKRRSFAFYLAYIKCFRTYSVYLSLRLPAQILYAGIHLCPLAARRSCFGYSLSHLRTAAACRLAVSATGGARKPNPSEGGEGTPAPCAEISCFGKDDSSERNPSGLLLAVN